MEDKIKLNEIIEEFIHSKCSFKKIESFKINYHPNNSSKDKFPLLYDNLNYIQCVFKEKSIQQKEKDLKLLIKDSSFEFILYKSDNALNIIKVFLIIVVNDYTIIEDEQIENFEEEKLVDINDDEAIIDDLNLFLYDFLKENKKNESIDKKLMGDSTNNINFFSHKENSKLFSDEEIKKIKMYESKIEINNKEKLDYILNILNPSVKEELMNKLLDEMPEELVNLMKKYKNVNFTNEMYLNYIDYKNKPKDTNEVNNLEKQEENQVINSPQKKEGTSDVNINDSSNKKQLFKIK